MIIKPDGRLAVQSGIGNLGTESTFDVHRVAAEILDVPWEKALDVVLKTYGYGYDRDENIVRVTTLENLKKGELSTEVFTLNYSQAEEVQKSLKDMLKPQWKGKIASTPYVTSLNILAAKEMWGKEAALEYVRQLSKQVVGLIRCNEIERVASGEFLAFVMDCSGSQTFEAQAHGSPVEHVIPVDGAMLRHRMLTVPKNAEHPNAAKLFAEWLISDEGQKTIDSVGRESSRNDFKSKTSIEAAFGKGAKPLPVTDQMFLEDPKKWLDTYVKPIWEG